MQYTQEELREILAAHKDWRAGKDIGKRANFSGADLCEANFSGADLRSVDFSDAKLRGADFSDADLRGANLHYVNLFCANLRGVNLRGADLFCADLEGATLEGADLFCASFDRVNLTRTQGLTGRSVCPPKGSFTAFKKVRGSVVLELFIPASAERVSTLTGRQCRADAVHVTRALDSNKKVFTSKYNEAFTYVVGEWTRVKNFNNDRRTECAPGIHFFMEPEEAEDY